MPTRLTYGRDPSQWVDRLDPEGPSRGTVVVIHGGFWQARYAADLGATLAADPASRGWTALNVEYRRVGNGGGFPSTFDDIHAAINPVEGEGPVVTLGHSAGGHLAARAAARQRFDEWAGGVEVTHVVSQAGVLDLTSAYDQNLGGGAVQSLMGVAPDDPAYDLTDPARQVPLDVPVWCLHASDDRAVPISQSEGYVRAATEAGATAELIEVSGGHFDLIDTGTDAWRAIVDVLDLISPAAG
ncbi:alpha/beta hydrolase family protein [Nocardioides sp. B-3]|uniref:alpha/beta hydrolase family protein n=1 Tax=Nocardioides sp. B-3 TaxID=2895565 RepID=UPI0021520024|nr:prolyl oligopeptidase family serine peptidase [Nocardioides sp. B-3]UUZ61541.1 alpha/beta fold hydrolase [Nocardioides sp. B-3]